MKPNHGRRKLDRIERLFAGTGNYPCDIAEYRGTLDEGALAKAYANLQFRYPAVGARIAVERGECDFDLIRNSDDQFTVVDGDDSTLISAIREVRNKDQDASRLILVRTDGGGRVALCVNHALFDFPSFRSLFNELWHIYTKLVTSAGISDNPDPVFPLSPERIIAERWLGSAPLIPEQSLSTLRSPRTKRVTQRTIEFGAENTNKLIAAARAKNTSVHALACSAILLSCEIIKRIPDKK